MGGVAKVQRAPGHLPEGEPSLLALLHRGRKTFRRLPFNRKLCRKKTSKVVANEELVGPLNSCVLERHAQRRVSLARHTRSAEGALAATART